MARLNRTMLGLKLCHEDMPKGANISLNRTMVGLKRGMASHCNFPRVSLNRTIIGLKRTWRYDLPLPECSVESHYNRIETCTVRNHHTQTKRGLN